MTENPNPNDDPGLPEDPAPGHEPAPPSPAAGKVKVMPLDEDQSIKKGIDVIET